VLSQKTVQQQFSILSLCISVWHDHHVSESRPRESTSESNMLLTSVKKQPVAKG